MSRLILLLLVVLAGLIAGPLVAGHSGYVLVKVAGYSIEMTVISLLLLLVIVVLVAGLAAQLVRRLLRLPLWAGGARQRRRQRRLKNMEQEGIMRLLAGDARGAWPVLKAAAAQSPKLSTRLLALDCANRLGFDDDARQLHDGIDDQQPMTALVLASIALDRGQLDEATRLLEQCRAPADGSWLQLRHELAERQQQWAEVEQLVPALRKLGYVDKAGASQQLYRVQAGQLQQLGQQQGAEAVWHHYRRLPRAQRKAAELMVAAAGPLVAAGDERGLGLLVDALRSGGDERLLTVIAQLPGLPAEQLSLEAKRRLKSRGDTPARLQFVADLCERAGRTTEAAGYRQQAHSLSH